MSHPPPRNTIQYANFVDSQMPQFDQKAMKSSQPIVKNQEYYGTVDSKNLYDNKYRMSTKTKLLNNFIKVEEEVQQKLKAITDSEKQIQHTELSEKINKMRAQSAQRTKSRQSETLRNQFFSNQNMTESQLQKIQGQTSSKALKTGSVARILNKTPGNNFNHLEHVSAKKLKGVFTPKIIEGEQKAIIAIMQRKAFDEDLEKLKKESLSANMIKIKRTFQERRNSNSKITQPVKQKFVIGQQTSPKSEFYNRLAIPKTQYRPENQAELPEVRDFVICQVGKLDEIKNPHIYQLFKENPTVQQSVMVQSRSKAFIPKQRQRMNSVDMTNNQSFEMDSIDKHNDEKVNENQTWWEIDYFDQHKPKKQVGYSQVQLKELQFLQNSTGFKRLSGMKKNSEYVQEIGHQMCVEKLQK